MLIQRGYDVCKAASAEVALERLAQERFDLLMLDVI